ncbi:MAG: MATE family efflux transporter [Erysipelotrichaceae bacterium]|nr:MATE family efflux transporter [Erysipelotrichaceae bacterium]
MAKGKNSLDIVNGPLLQNMFVFAVPLMFSQLLQILFNAADTIVVGKFAGESALAAVGATGSIVFLLVSIFNGLSTGSNVVIARYIGLGEHKKIEEAVHTSIFIGVAGGILLTVLGISLAPTLLRMMNTPEAIIASSTLYMRIYYSGVIFLLVYNFGSAVLRSKGDTRRPLMFLMLSGIVNILLNLFTVIVLHMAVAGVAIATVASEALSAFLVCYTLMKEDDATRLEWHKVRPTGSVILNIMRIGIPAGISGAVFSLSNAVIQSSINSFNDTSIVAGNSIGANIEGFVYIGMFAFSQATITFTSQCVGANRLDRIKPIVIYTFILSCISAALLGNGVYLFGPKLLGLYTNEASVIEVGMVRTRWVARLLVLNGIMDIFINSLRGMGYSTVPTVVMLAGICGVRLTWVWTVFPILKTLESIYWCYPVSWTVTSIIEFLIWLWAYRKVCVKKEAVA